MGQDSCKDINLAHLRMSEPLGSNRCSESQMEHFSFLNMHEQHRSWPQASISLRFFPLSKGNWQLGQFTPPSSLTTASLETPPLPSNFLIDCKSEMIRGKDRFSFTLYTHRGHFANCPEYNYFIWHMLGNNDAIVFRATLGLQTADVRKKTR